MKDSGVVFLNGSLTSEMKNNNLQTFNLDTDNKKTLIAVS